MLARIVGDVRFKEPLSFYTSLRIGGPAEFFIVPQDLDDVRYALAFAAQEGLPMMVLGGGNNVLFSDQTIHGIVVKLGGILSRAEFQGEEVAVGAGMSLSGLIREASSGIVVGRDHYDPGALDHLSEILVGRADDDLLDPRVGSRFHRRGRLQGRVEPERGVVVAQRQRDGAGGGRQRCGRAGEGRQRLHAAAWRRSCFPATSSYSRDETRWRATGCPRIRRR